MDQNMSGIHLLKLAYGVNVIILVPVVFGMLAGRGVAGIFEGRVQDSDGLRLLVASLWAAILLGSVAGFWWPRFFAALLPIQIIYKALWLLLFVLPLAQRSGWSHIPIGISVVFLMIVLTYPIILWLAYRAG
jgi:hypothetical protein